MHPYLHILLCSFLFTLTVTKKIEIQCPQQCKCDIFENLRRATCSNRNLASVESNIPQQTQILDLSSNHILRLNHKVFKEENLLSLKLLNISYNKISQIEMRAFEGLTQLKTLDLSYNSISYILREWFRSLESLKELYLRGNSFSKFDQGPEIVTETLTRLDLSHCRISHIAKTTFQELPNLENLDLSDNYLISFNVAVIKPLQSLSILNLSNNSISCDGSFKKVLSYCQQKGIRIDNICNKKKTEQPEKFQKMILAEPVDEKNSWVYDDEEIKNDNITQIVTVCNTTRGDVSLLQEIVNLSPFLSIMIPFIYGITVGFVIAYYFQNCVRKNDNFNNNSFRRKEPRRRSRRLSRISIRLKNPHDEERQFLPLQEAKLSESTPVLYRKNQITFY